MTGSESQVLRAGICGAAAALVSVYGWVGWLALLFLFCMGGDYVTGTAKALHGGQWRSALAREGLWHKAGMIAGVLTAAALDGVLWLMVHRLPEFGLPFDYKALATPLVLCWYIVTELGSILENAAALGAPVPPFLKKLLAVLSQTLDSGE